MKIEEEIEQDFREDMFWIMFSAIIISLGFLGLVIVGIIFG